MVNKDIRDMSRREKQSLIRQLEHVRIDKSYEVARIDREIRSHEAEIARLAKERDAARQRISDAEQSIAYLSD